MSIHRITTTAGRRELKERREPYWRKLQRGGYVGFRRCGYTGTWVARWRPKGGKTIYKSFGELADFDSSDMFNQATKLANAWFDARPTASRGRPTVNDAIDNYLANLMAEKGARAVADVQIRIDAHILPTFPMTFFLDSLSTAAINKWRNNFIPENADGETRRRAGATANRNLAAFKAILNRALKDGLILDDTAWRRVDRFKKTRGKRGGDEALSDEQISRLLKHSKDGFRDVVVGLLLTGMRPGREIENLRREQYKVRGNTATLEIHESKTGPRTVFLSREAKQYFDRLAASKTPKAALFSPGDGRPWREREAAAIMKKIKVIAKLPADTVLYSLRHSHITRALEGGATAKAVCDNCGTSIAMLEAHYWKAMREVRQAIMDSIQMLPAGL